MMAAMFSSVAGFLPNGTHVLRSKSATFWMACRWGEGYLVLWLRVLSLETCLWRQPRCNVGASPRSLRGLWQPGLRCCAILTIGVSPKTVGVDAMVQ